MEKLEEEHKICEKVCACLHASLICGDEKCIYPEGHNELNFWEDDLVESDEFLCVIAGEGFEHDFDYNGVIYTGIWHRVLHVIADKYIDYLDRLEKDTGLSVITDGNYYGIFYDRKLCSIANCPIGLSNIRTFIRNSGDIFKFDKLFETYRVPRKDDYETLNILSVVYCANCQAKIARDDSSLDKETDDLLCWNCYSEKYQSCDCCEESVKRVDIIGTKNGEYICQNCVDNYYKTCTNCGEIVPEGSISHIEDYELCSKCKDDICNYCDECEDYFIGDYDKHECN